MSRQVEKWYTDQQKANALKLWLINGNLREVSLSMSIPYDTLKGWKASKWWHEMSEDIRTEGHIALSHKMQQVANKAIEVTMDRLEGGDVVLSPTGELLRKPVNMRDAHQVAVSFQDRALKLQSGSQTDANPAVVDRLAQLADAFSKMITKQGKTNSEAIDVHFKESHEIPTSDQGTIPQEEDAEAGQEIVSALPDERQEGL